MFIGRGCEFNVSRSLKIGDGSLIASGCKFIDHDHGHALLNVPIRSQDTRDGPILIENNVWLGCNTIVLKGVTIGAGAIVGAGAVVTRSIPQNEIWAGAPARFVKQRGFENVCPINERRSS